jgi:hypothetical protein
MKENDASTEKTSNHNRYTLLSFLRTTLFQSPTLPTPPSHEARGWEGKGLFALSREQTGQSQTKTRLTRREGETH